MQERPSAYGGQRTTSEETGSFLQPRIQIQVSRVGSRHPIRANHLSGPQSYSFSLVVVVMVYVYVMHMCRYACMFEYVFRSEINVRNFPISFSRFFYLFFVFLFCFCF